MRPQFRNEIISVVAKSEYFVPEDFSFIFEEGSGTYSSHKLVITYVPEPSYIFNAHIPRSRTTDSRNSSCWEIKATVSPGEIGTKQDISVTSKEELLGAVSSWLGRMKEDLSATPVARRLDEHAHLIDNLIEQVDSFGNPDDYFTREEANTISEKLESMRSFFEQHLKETSSTKQVYEQRFSDLQKDIDVLKQQLSSLRHKGFVRSLFARLAKWGADPENRKLLSTGFEVVKGFLPKDGQS